MASALEVVRADDVIRVSGALLAEAIVAVDRERGAARLAIPGGSALAALAPARRQLADAWRRVHLTWVDERCVPRAHADSNCGAAYRTGALDAAHPPACELPLFLDGERGVEAVARVETGLDARFDGALDVLLLGMGEDGHVASIFDSRPARAGARVAFVDSSPKPPRQRITLTQDVLATARRGVLLAAGETKRSALERLLAGDATLAAAGLTGLTVVTDIDLGGAA